MKSAWAITWRQIFCIIMTVDKDSSWSWVVSAGAFITLLLYNGVVKSLGVLLPVLSQQFSQKSWVIGLCISHAWCWSDHVWVYQLVCSFKLLNFTDSVLSIVQCHREGIHQYQWIWVSSGTTDWHCFPCLKRILWDRQWTLPSIWIFFHTNDLFLHKCISINKTKQSSKFQSDPSSNCYNRRLKNKLLHSTVYFLTFFFVVVVVLECFDMWYFGNRVVIGAILFYLRQ